MQEGSLSYPLSDDVSALAELNGKTITVTGYVTGVSGNATKYLNLMVTSINDTTDDDENQGGTDPNPPANVTTIADIKAAENGEFTAAGVVVGVNAQSFLLKDDTGLILVYKGSTWTVDVAIGDQVTVTGATTVYGCAKQFGQTATYEKTGTATVTQPTPVELTVAELDAYATMETVAPLYIKVTGTLSVSNNKYFNLAIDGATIIGSITYPIDVDAVKAFEGQVIEVVGYITGVTGSGRYLNLMVTSINAMS